MIDRREALKVFGAATGLVWATPRLTSHSPPLGAGSPAPGHLEIRGSASGHSLITYSDPSCPPPALAQQQSNGTFTTDTLGGGSYQLLACVTVVDATHFSFLGTFVLTTDEGTLSGSLSGSGSPDGGTGGVNETLDLVVGSGTGRFDGATGEVRFDGRIGGTDEFTITGSISVNP